MSKILLSLLVLLCLTACGRSSPTSYYLLENPLPPVQTELMPVRSLRVAQVNVPGYLNRNNIVSRIDGQPRLVLAEFHLWAEPLGAGVRRIVEEILTRPMLECGVAVLPSGTDSPGDYVLTVDIVRLDGNFNEKAVLECRWALCDRDEQPVLRGVFSAEEMVKGADYNALVGTESRLVRDFSAYLASRLAPALKKQTLTRRAGR